MDVETPPETPRGLTEAEAARRLAQYGPNRLSEARLRSTWRIVLDALREPMFMLLFAAVGVYLLLGDLAESAFLFASALATTGLVVVQETRSERALSALRALAEPTARVIREGVERRVPAAEVVPGDLVLVGEGLRAPADATLLAGDVLTVDESVLTGESAPVLKAAGGSGDSSVFAGTLVVRGQGVAEVTQTGRGTRIGAIGVSLATLSQEPTPLQRSTRRVVRDLGVAAIVLACGVVLIHGLARGDWMAGALAGLTIGIALIPEEFPMALAVYTALGGRRLARAQVLARRTAAIEALGAISVLCVDKTGTLTRNHMAVAALWRDGKAWRPADGSVAGDMAGLLATAVRASAVHDLDPMDRALHEAAGDGLTPPGAPLRSSPLRPDRLAVVQAWADGDGGLDVAAKGAPEAILALCRAEAAERAAVERAVSDLAEQGLRVLAVARARCAADHGREPGEETFEFLGLTAFEDPVRDDVPPAVAAARAAGIAVTMITGDYPQTALAIARQAGLDVSGGVLTGAALAEMDEAAVREAAARVRVFARMTPDQKLRLVGALKANGERVGMFGDGVNDAPALEAAHVGVAMGLRGADVAREAADLVLLDDRFASIVGGVAEGRRIYANLQTALTYLVVAHIPIAGLALLPPLFGVSAVLFPLQVVLLELVIDPMCAMVFEGRPAAAEAMRRPPRRAEDPLFGPRRLTVAMAQGVALLAVVFGAYLLLLGVASEGQARAASLVCLVSANLAMAGVLATVHGAWDTRERGAFAVIVALAVATLAAAVYTPWLARLFQFEPPAPGVLALVAGAGVIAGLATAFAAKIPVGGRARGVA
ncbi:MAG: HAD-IC family P-type ATPase [Phenylobacterium sp.]|uniref:cation-translocating P-type ATPase n=1 Tax=Phenylobacterium sp. TaxID=1871053 RepID=UPI0025EF87EA|nr:cation-translocating P-type ATPase [Phenylobacterium sp.]MBI1198899.1 HAD-IC family P-type ATPase [Phenylobacterium sp.]